MGGGRGSNDGRSGEDYKEMLKDTSEKTQSAEYESTVNEHINQRLADYNARDADKTRQHLDDIKATIEKDLGTTISLRFGGSISKHTYVDGLSDSDILVLIDKTELSDKTPAQVLQYIKERLSEERLSNVKEITVGKLAVTITYNDGSEIQLLPAIRKGDGFKIPSQRKDEWSNVIRPDKFAERLTSVNQSCNGKVIPVIKLVKGINSQFPEEQQLTGYNIESLAIQIFKSYPKDKPTTTKEMLKYFFEKAKDAVKTPIKDSTGQSIHVDDYLGSENSRERERVSYILDKVHRRMDNADKIESVEEWDAILG